MTSWLKGRGFLRRLLPLCLACGSGAAPSAEEGSAAVAPEGSYGSFRAADPAEARALEFSSKALGPAVADVALRIGQLEFDAHFDYDKGEVVTDGHGVGLDRAAHALLREAAEAFSGAVVDAAPDADESSEPGAPNEPASSTVAVAAFERRVLYAAIVVWQQSGGIPLPRKAFALPRADEPGITDKSLRDDGIACVTPGVTYEVSYTHGSVTVNDRVVTADSHSCNGLCGPACVLLTPFAMWTLDCLEHDECCADIDGGLDCWVPLGECGDEYESAMGDFLLGVDPFARHCGG
jgi:hypothetical protein